MILRKDRPVDAQSGSGSGINGAAVAWQRTIPVKGCTFNGYPGGRTRTDGASVCGSDILRKFAVSGNIQDGFCINGSSVINFRFILSKFCLVNGQDSVIMRNGAANTLNGWIVFKFTWADNIFRTVPPQFYRTAAGGIIAVKQWAGDLEFSDTVDSSAEIRYPLGINWGIIADKAAVLNYQFGFVPWRKNGSAFGSFISRKGTSVYQRFAGIINGAAIVGAWAVGIKNRVINFQRSAVINCSAGWRRCILRKTGIVNFKRFGRTCIINCPAVICLIVFKNAVLADGHIADVKDGSAKSAGNPLTESYTV